MTLQSYDDIQKGYKKNIYAYKKMFKLFLVYLLSLPIKIFLIIFSIHNGSYLPVWGWIILFIRKVFVIALPLSCESIDIFLNINTVLYYDIWAASSKKNVTYMENNWRMKATNISKVSLVNLSNEEKINLGLIKSTGSKYLKIELKNEKVKYFYVQNFTNKQIDYVINKLNNEPRCQVPKISSYLLYKIFFSIAILF